MSKETRKRSWTFVVYADSAPEDWRRILAEACVPMFVSPYHDADVNPDGTPKKPHWHVVVMYTSLHAEKDAQEISDLCSGVKVQPVKDIVGMSRYLCHLDNPEKVQYPICDVQAFGGADYLEKVSKAADTDSALGEMMDFCIDQGCFSFFSLSNYARQYRPDWFRVITSSRTVFLTAWLKSMQWQIREDEAWAQALAQAPAPEPEPLGAWAVVRDEDGRLVTTFDTREEADALVKHEATREGGNPCHVEATGGESTEPSANGA